MNDSKVPEISRVLSIDYGAKRIGLALSDPLYIFAYSYKTIPNDDKLFSVITEVINEMNIAKIVLGIPYQDNGQLSSNAGDILKFKVQLEKRFSLDIILWDESYSSQIAKDRIISSVTKKSKRRNKGLVDSSSASIFLQEYLDSLKKNT